MEVSNSDIVFEEIHVASKENLMSSVDKYTLENSLNHHDDPSYFFRGAVFGFILCVPIWVFILWLINR